MLFSLNVLDQNEFKVAPHFFALMQGWSERWHRVDGEVCGQKHSQATQTEGHYIRWAPEQFIPLGTVRMFHVITGAVFAFLPVCCDLEQFEFLLIEVHYRMTVYLLL